MRLKIVVLLTAAKVFLDIGYVVSVSPMFSYAGLVLSPDPLKVAASYLIVIAFSAWMPARIQRASQFHFLILILFILLPCLSLWALRDDQTAYAILATLSFLIVLVTIKLPGLQGSKLDFGSVVFLAIVASLAVTLAIILIHRDAFALISFDLLTVYERRTTVHDTILSGVAAYLAPWYAKSVNLVFFVWCLWRRRYALGTLALIGQILMYGLTTHREYLFYPFVVLAVFVLGRNTTALGTRFLVAATCLIVTSILVHTILDFRILSSIALYRSFFATALNHFEYYAFFQTQPFVFLSNGVLAPLAEYPFSAPIPELIGSDRYGAGTVAFANTGFPASAYMHFGSIGVVCYAVLVGLLLRLFDTMIGARIPLRAGIAMSTPAAFQLIHSDLTTALLTHGVGITLLCLWLIGARDELSHPSSIPISANR